MEIKINYPCISIRCDEQIKQNNDFCPAKRRNQRQKRRIKEANGAKGTDTRRWRTERAVYSLVKQPKSNNGGAAHPRCCPADCAPAPGTTPPAGPAELRTAPETSRSRQSSGIIPGKNRPLPPRQTLFRTEPLEDHNLPTMHRDYGRHMAHKPLRQRLNWCKQTRGSSRER